MTPAARHAHETADAVEDLAVRIWAWAARQRAARLARETANREAP
jgi:hypothetical protein